MQKYRLTLHLERIKIFQRHWRYYFQLSLNYLSTLCNAIILSAPWATSRYGHRQVNPLTVIFYYTIVCIVRLSHAFIRFVNKNIKHHLSKQRINVESTGVIHLQNNSRFHKTSVHCFRVVFILCRLEFEFVVTTTMICNNKNPFTKQKEPIVYHKNIGMNWNL